jgi:hypothetical protein
LEGSADLLRLFKHVFAVLVALDLLDHLVNCLGLLSPLALAHFELLLKQLVVWLSVASTKAVPQCRVLAVVVVEVKMMDGVARSTIDESGVVRILAIVDQDSPDVDKDEKGDGCDFGHGKQEGKYVVGQSLSIAVEWVESVRRKGSRHDPLVVRLMYILVHTWMVQAPVNPVNAEVCKDEEEGVLCPGVPICRTFVCCIVQLRVAAHFSQEPGHGQNCHYWEGDVGLLHLELDLVLEVSRVVECRLVKNEKVGESGEKEVHNYTKEPAIRA